MMNRQCVKTDYTFVQYKYTIKFPIGQIKAFIPMLILSIQLFHFDEWL